jgi:hypothetical protein
MAENVKSAEYKVSNYMGRIVENLQLFREWSAAFSGLVEPA